MEFRAEHEAEKTDLELSEIKARLQTYESLKEKRTKLIVSTATPVIAAVVVLAAAFVELRSVRAQRERLAHEQATTEQIRRIADIRDNQLAHPDPSTRSKAAAELAFMNPQLSEGTIPRLVEIAASDDPAVAEAAISTLVAWRTQLAAQSLTNLVNSGVGATRYDALEALARFKNEHGAHALLDFANASDARVSGRAKVLLALAYRELLLEQVVAAAQAPSSGRFRSLFNSVVLLSGEDVDAALVQVISALLAAGTGDEALDHVMCLQIGKAAAPVAEQLRGVLRQSNISPSRRLVAAAALLGTTYHQDAESLLLASPWSEAPVDRVAVSTRARLLPLLIKAGFTEVANKIAYDDAVNRTDGFIPVYLLKVEPTVEQLRALIDSYDPQVDLDRFRPTAKFLIDRDREYVLRKFGPWELQRQDQVEILSGSGLYTDRRRAFQIWFELIEGRLHQRDSSQLRALPAELKSAITEADAERVSEIFLHNPPPSNFDSSYWTLIGIQSLLGTPYEQAAVERLDALLRSGDITPYGRYDDLRSSYDFKRWGDDLLDEMRSANPAKFRADFRAEGDNIDRGLWMYMLELTGMSILTGRSNDARQIYSSWFDSLERVPVLGSAEIVLLSKGKKGKPTEYKDRLPAVQAILTSTYENLAWRMAFSACGEFGRPYDSTVHEIWIGLEGLKGTSFKFQDQ